MCRKWDHMKVVSNIFKKPLTKQLIVFKACKLYRISNKNSFEKTSHLLLVLLENFKNILGQMMASRSFISLLSVNRTYSLGRWVWVFLSFLFYLIKVAFSMKLNLSCWALECLHDLSPKRPQKNDDFIILWKPIFTSRFFIFFGNFG